MENLYLALIGLVVDFVNERRAAAKLSADEFQDWLQRNHHDQVVALLRQNSSTLISVKAILAQDREKLCGQLDRIDRQLVMLASDLAGC
jgi:hypothetical protein